MPEERPRITEIPDFASDAEEREWWDEHGADVDPDAFETVHMYFDIQPRGPRSKRLTLRLRPETIDRYRQIADDMGIGYTSLMVEVLDKWRPRKRRSAPARAHVGRDSPPLSTS